MKVAIVTHFPQDPDAPHGGVEAVCVNLARWLGTYDDLDIHVVTMDRTVDTVSISYRGRVAIHRLPGIKGHVLTTAIGKGRQKISRYLIALAPDVVHAHDTYGLMVKGLSIPRVFTVHGFIYGDTLVSGGRMAWLRSKIWRSVETSGWADQPHIISISPYVRERLTGIATGVIHDIDNPISERFFEISRNERKGVIFSAALISPRKNTLTLIDAFAKLISGGIEAELRLAGSVVEPHYGRLVEERISTHRLQNRVIMLGRISTDQVMKELSVSSIFALVSLEENSPMGIEEAMAARVPVVTSNRCGMPYMVRHGETGFLVEPNDPEDISRRMKQLLEDDALRARMGDKARFIAQDRFHPAEVAARTREVYYESTSNKRKY
jgi:glycosyltransferase involved in cell wall biosynthesis